MLKKIIPNLCGVPCGVPFGVPFGVLCGLPLGSSVGSHRKPHVGYTVGYPVGSSVGPSVESPVGCSVGSHPGFSPGSLLATPVLAENVLRNGYAKAFRYVDLLFPAAGGGHIDSQSVTHARTFALSNHHLHVYLD